MQKFHVKGRHQIFIKIKDNWHEEVKSKVKLI